MKLFCFVFLACRPALEGVLFFPSTQRVYLAPAPVFFITERGPVNVKIMLTARRQDLQSAQAASQSAYRPMKGTDTLQEHVCMVH